MPSLSASVPKVCTASRRTEIISLNSSESMAEREYLGSPRVIVIGCGVIGLSTGIRLLEAGYRVAIWARDLPPKTTSDVAAAIWYPYKAYPEEQVTRWAKRTYHVLSELVVVPESGVRMITCLEPFDSPAADPWWSCAVPGFRHATSDELPPGYADGYVFEIPLIETPRYLPYLIERFQTAGGSLSRHYVEDLAEPFADSDIIVNCSGLGARELVGDHRVYAIRGQIVRVAPLASRRVLIEEQGRSGLTYIVPRSDSCVLGGTAEEGAEDLTPDPATAQAIQERCLALEPALRGLAVLAHQVGLRPGRDVIRLEAKSWAPGKTLVHNYGHGGAGMTLSWGCAEEVVALLASRAPSSDRRPWTVDSGP